MAYSNTVCYFSVLEVRGLIGPKSPSVGVSMTAFLLEARGVCIFLFRVLEAARIPCFASSSIFLALGGQQTLSRDAIFGLTLLPPPSPLKDPCDYTESARSSR